MRHMSNLNFFLLTALVMYIAGGAGLYVCIQDDYRYSSFSKGQKVFLKILCGPVCWLYALVALIAGLVSPLWRRFWNWLGNIK